MGAREAATGSQHKHEPEWDVRGFEPSYSTLSSLPHYHGDIARDLLLGAVALSLISVPLYADSLREQFPYIITGALVSVTAAALTDPHRRWTLMADAVVAGAAAIIYGSWGFTGYDSAGPLAFVLREAVALLYLFAFYFSVKTVRAFVLGEIGRHDRPGVLEGVAAHAPHESDERE